MFAQNLAFVNIYTRVDMKTAAVLQFIDRERGSFTCIHRYQYTIQPARNASLPWFIGFETVGHDGLAGGSGEYIIAQANDAPCGDIEFQVLQVAFWLH